MEEPCLQVNNCNANSQTYDADSSSKMHQKNDRTLVKAVDIAQEAVILNRSKILARPIFPTYQSYVQYLQGKR
jgi:3'-phosphoadenosine 5'-phosphosulfate (PAPS) 3'-phosphatase